MPKSFHNLQSAPKRKTRTPKRGPILRKGMTGTPREYRYTSDIVSHVFGYTPVGYDKQVEKHIDSSLVFDTIGERKLWNPITPEAASVHDKAINGATRKIRRFAESQLIRACTNCKQVLNLRHTIKMERKAYE